MAKKGDIVVFERSGTGATYAFGSQAARDAAKSKEPPKKSYHIEVVASADKEGNVKRVVGGGAIDKHNDYRGKVVMTLPKERMGDAEQVRRALWEDQHKFTSLAEVKAAAEPHLAPAVAPPTHKVYTAGGHDLQSSWYDNPIRTASGKLKPMAPEPGAGPLVDAAYREYMKDPAKRFQSLVAAAPSERAMAVKFAKMSAGASARLGEPRKVEAKPALAKSGPVIDSALRSRIETLAKTNPEISKAIAKVTKPEPAYISPQELAEKWRQAYGDRASLGATAPGSTAMSERQARESGSLNRPEGAKPAPQVTPAKGADATPRVSGLPDLRDRLSALPKGQLARIAEGLQLRNPSPGAKFSDLSRTAISNAIAFGHTWDGKILSDAELHAAVASSSKRAKPASAPKTKAATQSPAASVETAVPASAEEKRFAEAKRFADMQADIYARNPSSFAAASHHSDAQRGLKAAEQALRAAPVPASPPSSGDLTGGAKETAGSVKQLEVTPSSIQTAHDKPAGISAPGKKEPKAKLTKAMGAPVADQEAVLRTMFTGDKPSYRIMDELSSQHTAAIDKLHREGLIAGSHKAGFVLSKQGAQIASKLPEAAPKPESSGLHGTQNPNNLQAIVEGKKARAKPKAEKTPKAPKAEAQAIVIARAEMTGLQPTGKQTRFDGVNYRPEFKPAPEAKAAMWTNKGGPEELAKAQAHAAKEGWKVFTYPTSEKDPLGKAKAAALEAHAKETAPKPAEKPARKPRAPKAAPVATSAPVLPPVKPVEAAKAKTKIVRVNTAAVANDVHSKPAGIGSTSGYFHTLDRAKEALGQSKLARLIISETGARRLESPDGRWSVRDPAPGSYREISAKEARSIARAARPAAAPKPAPKIDPTPTLAAQGIQRGKPAANPVVPAPKAAEPVKAPKAKGSKALGVGLGVAAVGVAALVAANKAKAEGAGTGGQLKEAATEGAKATGEVGAWTVGMGAATTGLMRAGMTAAKAVPLVGAGLMAGGALKGAWDARHDGAKAMATGAAKGAWDMSLPGMVVNTGLAAKDAVQTRMATPSAAQPASFAAAQERFSAMKAAAKASEASEKKKGWSNAARISAYQHKHPGGTALPYGGAVEPPKPIQLADKKK